MTYSGQIGTYFELPDNGIYVYGANTEFRHGKGSALLAKDKYGAIYGQPANANPLQGRSYAIVTKNLRKKTHPSVSEQRIIDQIGKLYHVADTELKDKLLYVAYRGKTKNLNGYTSDEMAAMFAAPDVIQIPTNVIFEEHFHELVVKHFTNKKKIQSLF
jgi:hypothetical protein